MRPERARTNRRTFRAAPFALRLSLLAATACAAVALPGCTVGPDYKRPDAKLPAHFDGAPTTRPANPAFAWWSQFKDPILDSLIQRALAANLDLRMAETRVIEARAFYAVTSAGRYPTANFATGYTLTRASASAFNLSNLGSLSRNAGGSTGGSTTGGSTGGQNSGLPPGNPLAGLASFGTTIQLFQAGFDASWELDVFGGVRRSVQAAQADVEASLEDHRDALVTLLSEVARNYVELRGYQKQLQIARQNLDAQREVVDLTQALLSSSGTALDVARAKALYASIESSIPTLTVQTVRSIRHLGILIGREPSALQAELSPFKELPYQTPEVPVGLPSDLLRNRPDVRRAERQLAAATARVGVATADLFPKFSLTGSFGQQADQFNLLGNGSSRYYAVGPAVNWPVFDFGRIRANIGVQTARTEQALARYEQTILASMEDVENSLMAYTQEQSRRKSLIASVDASRQAAQLAELKYKHDVTNFLEVLDARRSLLAAQDELAQSERNVASNLVALYKALGGGWAAVEAQPAGR